MLIDLFLSIKSWIAVCVLLCMFILREYVMTYWAGILDEVVNRDKPGRRCMLTNPKRQRRKLNPRRKAASCSDNKVFFLGSSHPGLYLTRREAQSVALLMRGYTLKEIGLRLSLSPRTIECYARNVRSKLNCNSRAQVIEAIIASGFDIKQVALPLGGATG